MSDEDKRPLTSPTPPEETPPQQNDNEAEELNTVSLFDLMQELDNEPDPVPPPMIAEQPTVVHDPLKVDESDLPPDEAPTQLMDITQEPTVPQPMTTMPTRPPKDEASVEQDVRERPLVIDPEATVVQPRVAFSEQRPVEEQPTQAEPLMPTRPPKRERPTTPDHQPTVPIVPQHRATTPTTTDQPHTRPRVIDKPSKQPKKTRRAPIRWRSCLTIFLIGGLLTTILAVIIGAFGYITIASDLPNPADLRAKASNFETALILDRDGNVLYSLADPNAGNRTYVTLDNISQDLIDGTIATEDSRFYENPGFDPIGILRAIVQAAQEREFVSGASTITQQLVRATLLDEEERTERSFQRKVREIILAAELSRTYSKEEILELYLNEIYYGNLAYGIEAASQTYFNKSANELTLAEASLLAGLPQAPAAWDPYTAPELARGRQSEVLALMLAGEYITRDEANQAMNITNEFIRDLEPPEVTIKHPHFSLTVLQQAEDLLGSQAIYRGGLRIHTTLDPQAQLLAEQVIANHVGNINNAGANNVALVTIDPQTGQILALVGSADFNNEAISGQVNMALQPRQPGSTIKPFVYLAAMEQGWTPSTLIWDVPTSFPDGANAPYQPKNYDDEFHGPLLLRPSLGNSYNIPAVKALEFVGVCNFISRAQDFGLRSLQDDGCANVEVGSPRNYGLALSLGGGAISPLEMTTAYAMLANEGELISPYSVSRIENRQGEILYEQPPADGDPQLVVRPSHAYILSNMLSDNSARQPEFGVNNPLVISGRAVAAKTGTSGTSGADVRDAWTIGYTPQAVTAVWVGNTDNTPLAQGQSGTRVASPIWNSFMAQYLASFEPIPFPRPADVVDVEICADSGVRYAGNNCAERKVEQFAADQLPTEGDSFLQQLPIDLWTNQIATDACRESVYDATFFNLVVVAPNDTVLQRNKQAAQSWLENSNAGRSWAEQRNISFPLRLPPTDYCNSETPRPRAEITAPTNGAEIINEIAIQGSAQAPNFTGYLLEYGLGQQPGGWAQVQDRRETAVDNNLLANWNTEGIQTGAITLRLTVFGPDNPYTTERDEVQLSRQISLQLLEPTATPTPTPTNTPTATNTPTPTNTPTATSTPTITPTPTATTEPQTPTPTNTPFSGIIATEEPPPDE